MVNSQDCWLRKPAHMSFRSMLLSPPSKGSHWFSFPSAAWEQAQFSRASPQKRAKFWPPHGLCLYGGRDIQATTPRTHHLSITPQLTPRAGDRHVFPTAAASCFLLCQLYTAACDPSERSFPVPNSPTASQLTQNKTQMATLAAETPKSGLWLHLLPLSSPLTAPASLASCVLACMCQGPLPLVFLLPRYPCSPSLTSFRTAHMSLQGTYGFP